MLLGDLDAKYPGLWWALAIIISCGTIAGALIPEFTKVFTSTKSRHVQEVRQCSPSRRRLSEHPLRFCGR